jgi:hypothetical protein
MAFPNVWLIDALLPMNEDDGKRKISPESRKYVLTV